MTAPTDLPAPDARRRRTLLLAAIGAVSLVLAVIVVGPPAVTGEPYDPDSAAPDGLLGLVRLFEEVDVEVDVALEPPADASTRVLVAVDLLSDARRASLLAWVERGGTLVVADPGSALHGLEPVARPLADLAGGSARAPGCELAALDGVDATLHGDWTAYSVGGPAADATTCFEVDEGRAWLVVTPRGEGTLVALGSAAPFTNARLDAADNAVLAAALLGPEPGATLRIVPRPPVGEGDQPMWSLVPRGTGPALLLLAVAALVAVVARGRRLGQPVAERLPPTLPAAELTTSLADLLHRTGDRQLAADRLRQAVRREAVARLGVRDDLSPAELAGTLSQRVGVTPGLADRALLPVPVADDATLIAVAAACAEMRVALRGDPDTSTRRHVGLTT